MNNEPPNDGQRPQDGDPPDGPPGEGSPSNHVTPDDQRPPDDHADHTPREHILFEGELPEEPPPLPPLTISPLDRLRRARAILDCVSEALQRDAEENSPHLADRALVVEVVRGELGEACHDLTTGHVM